MTNITRRVWEIISNDVSIRKDLSRKLINSRALAKYLIKTHNIQASLDSVISAIRRFESEEAFEENFKTIEQVLRGSNITTKTNISCLTLRENSANAKYLYTMLSDETFKASESLRITKGSEFLKVIADMNDVPRIKKIFSQSVILREDSNLAEIIIFLNEEAQRTRGVFARITNEIANKGINIVEIITCLPELLVFVKQTDLVTCHDSLFQLCNKMP